MRTEKQGYDCTSNGTETNERVGYTYRRLLPKSIGNLPQMGRSGQSPLVGACTAISQDDPFHLSHIPAELTAEMLRRKQKQTTTQPLEPGTVRATK